MGAVATFDYQAWVAEFPEFANVSLPTATSYFNRATMFLPNDGGSPLRTTDQQRAMLNLLTSHIAWLSAPRDASGNIAASGTPESGIVGRITSASEGSVSVGVGEYGSGESPSAAWYLTTRYGAEYWQAMAPFRQARFISRPTYVPSSIYPYRGPGFGFRGR